MSWLDCHASAIQAVTAIVTALATIVLVAVTARYVRLTGKLVDTAAAQLRALAEAQRTRRQELRSSMERLMLALASLPISFQRQQADQMIRDSGSWNDFDFGRFRTLAAEVSTRAGSNAAVVEVKMKYLADQIDKVKQVPVLTGVSWGTFAWAPWEIAINDARARLEAILKEVEG